MIHTTPISFHKGEQEIQRLLHVPSQENPTTPGLSPHATRLLHSSSLVAIGTTDSEGRPWTTLLGGEPGFARSLGQSMIGVKTVVDRKHDPVIEILLGSEKDGEVREMGKDGQSVSALGIHLATRNRIKLWGKIVAGALGHHGPEAEEEADGTAEVQLVFAIHQSLGNCPKYLNKKNIIPTRPQPLLLSDSPILCNQALELLEKADMFFISSQYESNMGTNYRGGPQGFVRVEQNDTSGTVIIYPELSGNRLYQTLGNLYTNPRAGLIFPNFDTGDALYVTGTTEIVIGKDAAAVLPRSNVVVKIHVVAARMVQQSLGFRGSMGERSPYNPPVRYLATERAQALPDEQAKNSKVAYANLLARDLLTPTIARFKFGISDPEAAGRWKPGQYVALAFEDELSLGYSHMRDDDPKSLNDDYVRTFTVSSASSGSLSNGINLSDDEFEIIIRNVGVVTNFMFRQNIRAGLEVPLRGFGGTFTIEQGPSEIVPFVAGGIGITPLLAHLSSLELNRIRLFWTINLHDIDLVFDTFCRYPSLAQYSMIFVSGIDELSPAAGEERMKKLNSTGARVHLRRILASDVEEQHNLGSTWYLCAGVSLRKSLLAWLPGRKVLYEDFNY